MTMRKLAATATTIAVLLGSAACASSTDSAPEGAGPTTLDFPTWQANEPGYKEFWAATTKEFESKHPGVTINLQQVAFADYQKMITTRFAASDPPDILELPTRYFASFADKGFLAPLDDDLKGSDILANWPAGQQKLSWKGKYEGVLLQNYGYVLFYNEKMLKDAHVAVPASWDELRSAAAKLTGHGVFGIAMDTTQDPNLLLELSWPVIGAGHQLVQNGQYTFTDPNIVAIAEQVRELSKSAPQGLASEQKRQYFVDGKAAFMIDGPFVGQLLAKATKEQQANIKAAPIPFQQTPGALSSSMHIPATLTGKKRDLAWEFIKMLSEPKWQDAFVEHTGTPAPRKGSGADASAKNQWLATYSQAVADAVDVVPNDTQVKLNYPVFADEVSKTVSKLLSTDTPPADLMALLQKSLEKKIPLKR